MNKEPKLAKPLPQLHPCDFGPHWNSTYYEIMQEYYWDPKLLGRVPANPAVFANEPEMLGNLRRMEVSINHILALFFALAPQDYISRLECEAFGDSTGQVYRSVGIFELRRTAPHDPTQPDLFMVSEDTCFSVEVKIASKSYLEQVIKYALLHHDYGTRRENVTKSRLLYLTPRPVSGTWKERFCDIDVMQTALEHFDYGAFLKKAKMAEAYSTDVLKVAALSMQVAHITFDQLNEFTKIYASSITPGAPYADTVRKLLDGLLHEFEFRRDLLNLGVEVPATGFTK